MSDVRSWFRAVRPTIVCGVLAAMCLLCQGNTVHAETFDDLDTSLSDYVQSIFNTRNGLPQDSIHAIAQAADGNLWFGTEEGFARYDGARAVTYDRISNPEMHDNNIRALVPALDGGVWVATRLSVFHFHEGHALSQAHLSNVNALHCDPAGTVWIGTENGLMVLSPDGSSAKAVPQVSSASAVNAVLPDTGAGLWLLTDAGLVHYEAGRARLLGAKDGLPQGKVSAVTVANDGTLWLATGSEILHWSGHVLGRYSFASVAGHPSAQALLLDGSGDLWIGFAHDGVAKLHRDKLLRYTVSDGLPSNEVTALFQDREANVWVGLNEGGVVGLHRGLFRTIGKREGLAENMVWTSLVARDGSVWAGTNTQGVEHIVPDRPIEHYGHDKGFPRGEVLSLLQDTDNTIWAGLDTGDLVHVSSGLVHTFHNPRLQKVPLRSIVTAPGGDLFLLYNQDAGLVRFHKGQFTTEAANVQGRPTFATAAPDGSLWIGSDHYGVTHWNGKVLEHYGKEQGLDSQFISTIYLDPSGLVWVSMSSGGLALIRHDVVTNFTPQTGLFDYTVGAVLPDDYGYLWMSSNKGIWKVARQELLDVADGKLKSVHSLVYSPADGMRTAECNYGTSPSASSAPDGRMWFATPAGLTSIAPQHSMSYSGTPVAEVEAISVDGKNVPLDGPVLLSKGTHDLQADFTAPDFIAANHLKFRYRLAGFDSAWNYAGGRHQAFYTHLPPGDYMLLVQAEDGRGWPQKSASLSIIIPPHYWQTTWFRLLCVFSVLLICLGVYDVRVYALRRRGEVLQECVVQRTAELQEAIRVAEAAQQELKEQATHDSLTRLWNRRHIFELLRKEAKRADKDRLDLCVLMLDVDHFKCINDTVGHLGGDRVLEQVGNILVDQTRPYDYAGRYGGEEFLVVLCNCSLEAGLRRSETIRAAIEAAELEYDHTTIRITASFGVAEVPRGKGIEAALKEADLALYRAKQSGRNRVCVAGAASDLQEDGWENRQCGYAT